MRYKTKFYPSPSLRSLKQINTISKQPIIRFKLIFIIKPTSTSMIPNLFIWCNSYQFIPVATVRPQCLIKQCGKHNLFKCNIDNNTISLFCQILDTWPNLTQLWEFYKWVKRVSTVVLQNRHIICAPGIFFFPNYITGFEGPQRWLSLKI